MARQERTLDPDSGPLAAFAHDPRELRRTAGTPTYRELARIAGYSASTLSEVAKGVQQPSLDVVLAYVGACGGDIAEWRRRWDDLSSGGPAPEPGGPQPQPQPQPQTRTPAPSTRPEQDGAETGAPDPEPTGATGATKTRRRAWRRPRARIRCRRRAPSHSP